MINTLSIRYYLNEYKAKGKKSPIYLRITLDRKKAEAATSYYLEPKEWDESLQRTKKNKQINEDLIANEQKVYDIVRNLEKTKKPITAHI